MFMFQAVPWYLIVAMIVVVIASVVTMGVIFEDIKQWVKNR